MNDFNWNRYLLWLGGVLLLAWLVYWYTQREWDERITWEPSSEFQRNPFLAAKLFFQLRDVDINVYRRLKVLDEILYSEEAEAHMIIVADGYRALNTEQVERLRNWMEDGGNVVMSLENRFEPGRYGETRWDDALIGKSGTENDRLDKREDLLLSSLGVFRIEADVEALEEARKSEKVGEHTFEEGAETLEGTDTLEEKDQEAEEQIGSQLVNEMLDSVLDPREDFCTNNDIAELELNSSSNFLRVHHYGSDWRWDVGRAETIFSTEDAGGTLFAQISVGAGRLTLMPGDEVWSNVLIGCEDNAWLLASLGGFSHRVDFIRNLDAQSLLLKLWQYSVIGVLATLFMLIVWLWRHWVRFGSVLELESRSERQFGDHLRAIGQLFWRYKLGDELLEPARRDIWTALHRRMQNFHDADEGERLDILEEITGINRQALVFGLAPIDKQAGARVFIERAEILRIIKEKL